MLQCNSCRWLFLSSAFVAVPLALRPELPIELCISQHKIPEVCVGQSSHLWSPKAPSMMYSFKNCCWSPAIDSECIAAHINALCFLLIILWNHVAHVNYVHWSPHQARPATILTESDQLSATGSFPGTPAAELPVLPTPGAPAQFQKCVPVPWDEAEDP